MRFFSRAAGPRVDRLVVGLGNPGDGYAATRHNVGFQVVDRLAKRARLEFATKAADSRIAEGTLGGQRVAIVRPQTFMNDSGRAVGKLLDRYRLTPEELLVVYDDIDLRLAPLRLGSVRHRVKPAELLVVYDDVDLPLGHVRIRAKGGPGTHNGMRSVVSEVGEAFPRVQCGVAPADPGAEIRGDLADYVLQPFDADERDAAEAMIMRAAEAIEVALRDGVDAAMARFNA